MQFKAEFPRQVMNFPIELLEMTIQESPFLLLNLYAPTKLNEQIAFFQEILFAVQSANFDAEFRVVIGGDFNVHLDADLDN